MSLFASIARMFNGKPSWPDALVRLSEDPVALAKVLVLFRMVLADGIVRPAQLTAFERICERQFGISPRDMAELHALLDSPQARSTEKEAFELLHQLDTAERSALLDDMMLIARANSSVDVREDNLIRRTASLLGLDLETGGGTERDRE